ncbi:MAG TPA: response regulator [Tahibacter sp.]|nr:response regulator [Tahibacter sp.]
MNAPRHVLIVEDEPKIAAALRDYVEAAGHRASTLARGDGVAAWVREHAPDAVLLDVMLPGRDGVDVCRDIRAFSTIPIIMVTARVDEIDRLIGLDAGADDYVCKPFSPRELLARLAAVLRRASGFASTDAPRVVLDAERFEVRVDGRAMAVTPVEFRLLKRLTERPGKVYSRQQLLDAAYDDHRIVADRTVDSHLRNLRRKFSEFGFDPIASVYGVGFRFETP